MLLLIAYTYTDKREILGIFNRGGEYIKELSYIVYATLEKIFAWIFVPNEENVCTVTVFF